MSKMTMPTVDVVRFQESDVIVASGIMNVGNLGNGGKSEDGTWDFGDCKYTSGDINGNPSYFVDQMNSYFGTNFNSPSDFILDGRTGTDIATLAVNDIDDIAEHPSSDGAYNGIWRWNGSRFVQ